MAVVRHCNMCGKELDMWDIQNDFSLSNDIGYGSENDMCKLDLHLCCKCMDNIIEKCSISPVKDIEM